MKIKNLNATVIEAGNLNTNTINGVNPHKLMEEVVQSKDEHLPLLNVTQLTVHSIDTSVLSNKPIAHFITTNEGVALNGTLKVTGNLSLNSDLNVNGLVDNCTVSSNHVLLSKGNQYLPCKYSVTVLR